MDIDMSQNGPEGELYQVMSCTQNMVIIGNLHSNINDQILRGLLEPFGFLQWCHVITGPAQTMGFAYAKFSDTATVDYLIDNAPFRITHDKANPIVIMKSKLRATSRFSTGGKIFITGLADHVTERSLKELVQSSGPYCEVQNSGADGYIVHMLTEWHSTNLVKTIREKKWATKDFSVTYYDDVNSTGGADGNKRIVFRPYNLDPNMESDQLSKKFSVIARNTARVLRDAYGKSRCCGLVFMNKPQEDTPFFSMYQEVKSENGEIRLVRKNRKACNRSRTERKPLENIECSIFPPSAEPPIQHKYYQLSKEHCCDIRTDTTVCRENVETFMKVLRGFNVHVSNVGDHSKQTFFDFFSKYGEVIDLALMKDIHEYAIVSFLKLKDARAAAADIRLQRSKGETEMYAEVIDSYHLSYSDSMNNFLTNVSTGSEYSFWNYTQYPIYKNFVHCVSDNGVVKRFSVINFNKIMKAATEIKQKHLLVAASSSEEIEEQSDDEDEPENTEQLNVTSESSDGEEEEQDLEKMDDIIVDVTKRVKKYFMTRTEDEIDKLLQVVRAMPRKELRHILANEEAFRVFCVKELVANARKTK